jgi:hypothetical protein
MKVLLEISNTAISSNTSTLPVYFSNPKSLIYIPEWYREKKVIPGIGLFL